MIYFGKKHLKYKNKKCEYATKTFDSIKEKNRYVVLKMMEKNGLINNLRTQVKFELQPKFKINNKNIREITYIADFCYTKNNEQIIEDVKGFRTELYKLKKKMFEYKYQVEISEV